MKWYWVIALWVLIAVPASSTSSESEALQQAFMLVHLLKAEYAKVNKENSILRARLPLSTPEQPTCPTTQLNKNDDISFAVDGDLAVPSRRLLLNNLTPGSTGSKRKHSHKSRRHEYEDMFGPHPGEKPTEPTEATSQSLPPSTLPTSSFAVRTVESTIQTASEVTQLLSTDASVHYEQTKANKESHSSKKEVKLKLAQQKKPTSRDPVIEQVASEIMNEMKDKTNSKLRFETAPLLNAKTERYTRFKVKGTYRIHQATSKRYPIPLPENNAFCFYHPDSALCRTFI